MMTPFDTRISQATPQHLTPLSDHERTLHRLHRATRRALWQRLAARLFGAAKRGPKASAPISPLS